MQFRRRRDPFWDLEGRNARHSRAARRMVGIVVILLSAVILALLLARIATINAHEVLLGPTRQLVFVSAGTDLLACCLVLVRELRHSPDT